VPFLALVSVSLFTGTNVTAQRYFVSMMPAAALIAGATIRGLRSIWPQLGVATVIAAFSVWNMVLPPYLQEDWRTAAEIERDAVSDPDTPVLVHSGFIEGKQVDWLTHPERSDYLTAPASMYPLEGRVFALPYDLDAAAEIYLEQLVTSELTRSKEFILVSRGGNPFGGWLTARLGPEGYSSTELANLSDQILVFRFARP
jgi:hypothetical protein